MRDKKIEFVSDSDDYCLLRYKRADNSWFMGKIKNGDDIMPLIKELLEAAENAD